MDSQILWMGKPVLSEADAKRLERETAIKAFSKKTNYHTAAKEVYDSYVQEQHANAAAFHIKGMKAAVGAGSMEDAKKHWAAYSDHLKALGLEGRAVGKPPSRVADRLQEQSPYRFTQHPADVFQAQTKPPDSDIVQNPIGDMAKAMKPYADAILTPLNPHEQDWSGRLNLYDVDPSAYAVHVEKKGDTKYARLFHHGTEVGGMERTGTLTRNTVPPAHSHTLPALHSILTTQW